MYRIARKTSNLEGGVQFPVEVPKMDLKHKWINNISVNGDKVHISFSYRDGLETESIDMFKYQIKEIYDKVFK